MRAGQFQLLGTRRFAPLFIAQAIGAFNDNAFKAAIAILVTYEIAGGSEAALIITVATGLFVLPFFLFSALAGELADTHDKAALARIIKLAEIGIMAFAAISLQFDNPWVMIAFLFLTGTQSTFFGPIKYAILPQLLRREELLGGNGLIEMATFVSILLGTMFGGILVLVEEGRTIVGIATVALAVLGYIASRFIPAAPPAATRLRPGLNILRSTAFVLKDAALRPQVFLAILGISWFWFLGAVFLTELPVLTKETLHGNEAVANFLIAAFTIGIATGSLFANQLLGGEVSTRYVPFAGVLLTLVMLELCFATLAIGPRVAPDLHGIATFLATPGGLRVFVDLVLVSFIAGLYVVPLYAFVQARTPPARRARMIAANNIVNAGFMTVAAGLAAAGLAAGLTIPELFLALTAMNALAAAYALKILPLDTLRLLERGLFRLLYGARIEGLENFRAAGRRTVIVANHPSRMDALLLGAFLPLRVHYAEFGFAGEKGSRLARLFFDVLPLDPANPMAARGLVKEVKKGGRLLMFPEGRPSPTGALLKVRDEAAMIAHMAGARLLPIRIDGSQHARLGGPGRRWFPRIKLTVLPAVRLTAERNELSRALDDLMSDLMFRTEPIDRHLVEALIAARSTYGTRTVAVEDAQRTSLSYSRLLMGSFVLGRAIAKATPNEATVAVLLPTAAGCLVTFMGLLAFGRIPALLNYVTGAHNMAAALATAQVKTLVTSRRFIEQGGFEMVLAALAEKARIIYLEDLREGLVLSDKLHGLWARAFPTSTLKRTTASLDPNAPAAILFTSGSEGAPKGVALSHRNLLASCAQVSARIDFSREDKVFNALPMFHAFGLTVGTLLPVLYGVGTFLYPSPLHYKIVPELCYDSQATILLTTDTFLMGYGRNADPMDLRSVRYVVCGAEPVKPETRALFSERFGLRVIEGYGCTECSPVIAANTPKYFRSSTVGRIFDGMEHRLEPVEGIEGAGRLMIRGPNVMLGYIKPEAPGEIVPPAGGWHDTGDIVAIDGEGYVTIVGRLKRFAKIGGEMVPLGSVESEIAKEYPASQHAVVSVPERRKGEQLVLVTTEPSLDRNRLLFALRTAGLSEIMIPRQVIEMPELPTLGSGKTDYVTIGNLARDRLGV